MAKRIIKLGDANRMHVGYHGALFRNRNRSFTFKLEEPEIIYYHTKHQGKKFHPVKNYFYLELHKYSDDSQYIHSHLFPVYNEVPWVVDMECIMFQLFGRTFINEPLINKINREYWKDSRYRDMFLMKLDLFATRYCRGILYWSLAELNSTRSFFEHYDLMDAPEARRFLRKAIVAYPVVKPLVKKASINNPCTVIFLARDFELKGGPIALAAFRKLHDFDPSLRLIYCGPIPAHYLRTYADLLNDIIYLDEVEYKDSVYLLRISDILIYPTVSEAFGYTLIEALSAGCIPITYTSPSVGATKEIVTHNKNGLIFDLPDGVIIDEEAQLFCEAIIDMYSNKRKLLSMKRKGLKEVKDGKFSYAKRIDFYKKVFDQPITGKKKISVDPARYVKSRYSSWSLARLIARYKRANKIPSRVFMNFVGETIELS